jgi:L-alanine-DL-glutamate epimerase-like enolase superfamily enzyme
MQITDVRIFPFQLRRSDSGWRTSTYSASVVNSLIVQLVTDQGVAGIGATTAIMSYGDTSEAVQSTIRDLFAPRIIGCDPRNVEPILDDLYRNARHSHHARCAIDLALYDLNGKLLGVPVYQLLGGAFRKEVPVIRMVGLKAPLAQAEAAAAFVQQGYRALKLKIGTNPREDVARVAEVRKAVGDSILLTVDANGAYDVKTAIWVIKRLEDFDVRVAEQPTSYGDLEAISLVSHAVDMPVMADQVVTTPADALSLVRHQAADLVSIKVINGGLLAAQKMRAVCEASNVPYHFGGVATTRIVDAAAVHLAVACPESAIACEVGEFMGLDGDIASGFDVVGGVARVPEGPGLGIDVDLASVGAR